MGNLLTLTIDGQTVSAPAGTLVVEAAKKLGIDIPVFCYHPKLKPVGMCRMCLVEIGRPAVDRATGQVQLEADGSPKIQFGPKLETACTTPVSEGMVVVTSSKAVADARREMLEFILTSHPLDCPVCDKGGECPLQNLTLAFGPGQSRFLFDEKMRLAKHVPLGELIYLDRERCIQCGRCIRFQDEVVDDPVIAFAQRGRALEIITGSEPGFDSIFSGNTTDICPVGALTTADFRFGARPWELKASASLCNHCPVGCNITFNVRREAKAEGKTVIKRVMPRQNEAVNEIWICDKGRLAYHYTESEERLSRPLVRKDGRLAPASWEEALDLAAARIGAAGEGLLALAGGRLSNEDLFNLRQLTAAQGGSAVLYSDMAGGDLTAQVGLAPGSNLGELGKGDAILVAACDLHQEAPIWWLRLKQAAERGAILIVANPRPTRLDKFAAHLLRYPYGQESALIESLAPARAVKAAQPVRAAAEAFAAAGNAVIFYGSEGLGLAGSAALAAACARLLVETKHTGRPNNGLVAAWPHGNTQGAWEMGFRPREDLPAALSGAKAVYVAAADPAGDDPRLEQALQEAGFLVVQELFLSETAKLADVVLPALPYTEREGSLTSGERRVQRYYPALPPRPGPRPDFTITAGLGERLGCSLEGRSASLVMQQIAAALADYAGLSYQKLAEVSEQWPVIGRSDLYYGGTAYDNHQGLGVQLPCAAQHGEPPDLPAVRPPSLPEASQGSLLVLPVTRLYDRGALLLPSRLLNRRLAKPALWLHPGLAAGLGLAQGGSYQFTLNDAAFMLEIELDETLPPDVGLLPRSLGLPLAAPALLKLPSVVTG